MWYGAPPNPPAQKRTSAPVWIVVLFLFFGGCVAPRIISRAVSGAVPSGMRSESGSLSNADAEIVVDEFESIERDDAFEPRTDLGKELKAMVLRSQKADDEFAAALERAPYENLVASARNGSSEGRKKSIREIDDLRAACDANVRAVEAYADEVERFFRTRMGQSSPVPETLRANSRELDRLHRELLAAGESLLLFCERSKPTLDSKSRLTFASQAQTVRYAALLSDVVKAYEALSAKALAVEEEVKSASNALP